MNYEITFPILPKVNVNRPYQSNLFKFLILDENGTELKEINGDWTKFLVNKKGKTFKRFEPEVTP